MARDHWPVVRDGRYRRPSDGRTFQRFRCQHCHRRFSTRTFAPDYWLRKRSLFPRIASLATEGPGLRQSARFLRLSHATVGRHLARAGRHCLLLHRRLLRASPPREPIVIDGFETFEFSQFFPFHLNLAVGQQSWCLFHFTDSPLRRKGAMTPGQKRRRTHLEETLGRPDPKAIENAVLELLRFTLPWVETPAPVCHSDDHPAYRRALKRLCEIRLRRGLPPVRHHVTSSRERRTAANHLFPVNLADLLLRHAQAAHRRETIAFCKRRQAAIERLAIFTIWRNLIKHQRENAPGITAGMAAGITRRSWSWSQVFRQRLFPRRHLLPGSWWDYYWRRVRTLPLGNAQNAHELKYAF